MFHLGLFTFMLDVQPPHLQDIGYIKVERNGPRLYVSYFPCLGGLRLFLNPNCHFSLPLSPSKVIFHWSVWVLFDGRTDYSLAFFTSGVLSPMTTELAIVSRNLEGVGCQ